MSPVIADPNECYEIPRVIQRWIDLRAEYGHPVGKPGMIVTDGDVRSLVLRQLMADMWKSRLLNRLLQGKEPLPLPPPTAFSAPWYELVETGHGSAYVEFWPTTRAVDAVDTEVLIAINQCLWHVDERISRYGAGDDHYIVSHQGAPGRWELRPPTDDEIDLAGMKARTATGVAWGHVKDSDIPRLIDFRRRHAWHLDRLEGET